MQPVKWLIPTVAAVLGLGAEALRMPPEVVAPPALPRQSLEASLQVPPAVAAIIGRACRNCHSNETAWPWYASVPPASWLLARDVGRARTAMNFSTWSEGPGRKPGVAASLLAAACADIRSGRMPLPGYRMMHPESRLSPAEQGEFCDWSLGLSNRLLSQRLPGAP